MSLIAIPLAERRRESAKTSELPASTHDSTSVLEAHTVNLVRRQKHKELIEQARKGIGGRRKQTVHKAQGDEGTVNEAADQDIEDVEIGTLPSMADESTVR